MESAVQRMLDIEPVRVFIRSFPPSPVGMLDGLSHWYGLRAFRMRSHAEHGNEKGEKKKFVITIAQKFR